MGRPSLIIIPGTRYGSLVIIEYYPFCMENNKKIHAKVQCKCDCGNISIKVLYNLKNGHTKSCSIKCPYNSIIKHGFSVDKNSKLTKLSKEYVAFKNMINLCDNPKHIQYKYIGGKGITYHETLSTIEGFMSVMGKAPSKYHRFHRIDKDGDFEPGNVHWYLPGKKK